MLAVLSVGTVMMIPRAVVMHPSTVTPTLRYLDLSVDRDERRSIGAYGTGQAGTGVS